MSFRSNYKTHAFSREEVLKEAENYIRSAVAHNGCAYGDYVINVVVPLNYCKKFIHTLDFNTLNLWFKTEQDYVDFVKENQYEPTKIKIKIDISVSSTYPVNDFSINLLSWNGKELVANSLFYSVDYLIKCIMCRVCHILPGYRSFSLEDSGARTHINKFGQTFRIL